MRYLFLFIPIFICFSTAAQTTKYVKPDAADNPTADGSLANPYNDIAATVELLKTTGGEVIIVNGSYDMTDKEVTITTTSTESKVITIKPQSTAGVKLKFNGRFGFHFEETAKYIVLEGFELDGQTNSVDYWSVVAQGFWGDASIARNGGLAVILDGQYITIKDNYIHDWYQKAVEIRDARYIIIEGNIIHNIATTSLSGGHGIMRQQKGKEFTDDDISGVYRWDIRENMIFSVEQRIYSWVPSKGYIEMVIDEGKSILIDDPQDTDGIQEAMSARIIDNVVAFGSVDHIRLKSTPNLEVSHNSIYAEGANADGISDKQGDTDTPQFTNFICHLNAAQTVSGVSAIEIDKAVEQTEAAGGTPDVVDNYAMDGLIKPADQDSLHQLTGGQLFINPKAGNFRINPTLNLPSSLGVRTTVLDALDQKSSDFGVTVSAGDFDLDHLKLTQTILDNIPGLNDGIAGNETVFTDYGTMTSNYHTIKFDVVNGDWKTATESPNRQKFHLNELYYSWYESIDTNYKNTAGEDYDRIRWGDSEVKQNQVFDPAWLTVAQIKSTSSNTLINGYDNSFTLGGDLLVDFEDFTPQIGNTFDLISAGTISSGLTGDLFTKVHFEGYTPENYSLTVVDVGDKQVLRLSILAVLPIELLSFDARKEGRSANLIWVTLTEEGNDFFSVERSTNGEDWEAIGRVNGQGNSSTTRHYNFIDRTPSVGVNYYRLRQQDFDGKFSYSPMRAVEFSKQSIPVRPNPVDDWFIVTTDVPLDKIQIFDGLGVQVTRRCTIVDEGNGYHFSTDQLVSGIYFLRVSDKTIRIVVN